MFELGKSLKEAIVSPSRDYSPPPFIRKIVQDNADAWQRFEAVEFDPRVIAQDDLIVFLRQRFIQLRGPLDLSPEVSIVVPVHNEERYLLALYASLAAQRTRRRVEVVAVDNNSTRRGDVLSDGSIASRDDLTFFYGKTLGLHSVTYNELGNSIGLARQRGIEAAQAAVVCMTDGDTIVPPTWIDSITTPFFITETVIEPVGVATGNVHYFDRINVLRPFVDSFSPTRLNAVLSVLRNSHLQKRPVPRAWAYGPNMAFRQEDAIRVGGVPLTSSNEDLDFLNRLGEAGRIAFADQPEAAVWVSARRLSSKTLGPIILSAITGRDMIHEHKDGSPIVIR